jgi:hypothetical protein
MAPWSAGRIFWFFIFILFLIFYFCRAFPAAGTPLTEPQNVSQQHSQENKVSGVFGMWLFAEHQILPNNSSRLFCVCKWLNRVLPQTTDANLYTFPLSHVHKQQLSNNVGLLGIVNQQEFEIICAALKVKMKSLLRILKCFKLSWSHNKLAKEELVLAKKTKLWSSLFAVKPWSRKPRCRTILCNQSLCYTMHFGARLELIYHLGQQPVLVYQKRSVQGWARKSPETFKKTSSICRCRASFLQFSQAVDRP